MRLFFAILIFLVFDVRAQFGGFQSVNAPFGARNAALGGQVVSLSDGDLMQFTHNPAVLDSVQETDLGVNFSPYFAGIYSFSGAYQAGIKKIGKLAMAVTYLNYGNFSETLDNGDEVGTFHAQDYVIALGKSHQVGPFTLGANLKYAYSGVAGYSTSIAMMDLGGVYRSPVADFTVGIVFRNFGWVIHDVTGTADSSVPFDVQISTSVKPEHMPFRFSVSLHHLASKNLYFENSEQISSSRVVEIADQLLRRVNVGTELIIHKNVQFLFGYSHLVRQELKLSQSGYGAGISYGFLIGIRNFKLRYAHASYHAAGGTDFFSIQTSINSFRKVL